MKNQKELQIIFGSATTASAQSNRTKEGKSIANGMSTQMTSANRNAIGAKKPDFVPSTKFFKKNKKEKTNYETHHLH